MRVQTYDRPRVRFEAKRYQPQAHPDVALHRADALQRVVLIGLAVVIELRRGGNVQCQGSREEGKHVDCMRSAASRMW